MELSDVSYTPDRSLVYAYRLSKFRKIVICDIYDFDYNVKSTQFSMKLPDRALPVSVKADYVRNSLVIPK